MTTPTFPVVVDPTDLAGMFDRYARELLRYCTRRVGEQAAEDVVAETFLVAYEQRHRYDTGRGEMLPWLYGIATNLLRRHRRTEIRALRALARGDGGSSTVDGPGQRAADRVDAERTVARLSAVLAKLPRRQRDVLLLYAVAELEYAEIAAALEIPLGSVQSALHRARAKVRAALTSVVQGEAP
ncbi:RNA polymerase sigma factor [Phytohabitans rumicis]|uniref:DNA-directed RNA polymerase sigma-70 factor n=1 Tax=Phytohabitans rumicis TaxID=1076125 RepID=A0A6V8L0H7_9ACTN|nr:RNA polymerase sigma factor [Phytohabitans rumicis]GFJ89110.1 DNA-directed RNA polymerase sigma-70 factor [Phytohabitans rumicis]